MKKKIKSKKEKKENKKKEVKNTEKEDYKTLAVVVLVIIAIGAIYYFTQMGGTVPVNPGQNQTITTQDVFISNLANATEVLIVMDVRDVENQTIKEGIMQCGIDFAGSLGIADKDITTIALDDAGCVGIENITSNDDCLALVQNTTSFYITTGKQQNEYFENQLLVTINEEYEYQQCSITVAEE